MAEAREFVGEMDSNSVLQSTSLLVMRGALARAIDLLRDGPPQAMVPAAPAAPAPPEMPEAERYYQPRGEENARAGVDAMFAVANELRATRIATAEPSPEPVAVEDGLRALLAESLGLSESPPDASILAAIQLLHAEPTEALPVLPESDRSAARRRVRQATGLLEAYPAVEGAESRWLLDQIAKALVGTGKQYKALAASPGWSMGSTPAGAE